MKYREGFTLLEIMISLAIIGGLLVTVLYSLNYHLGIAQRHEFVTVASLLAMDKLAEIEKKSGDLNGEFPAPYNGYRYSAGIKASAYPGISEISVLVKKGPDEVRFTELIESAKIQ